MHGASLLQILQPESNYDNCYVASPTSRHGSKVEAAHSYTLNIKVVVIPHNCSHDAAGFPSIRANQMAKESTMHDALSLAYSLVRHEFLSNRAASLAKAKRRDAGHC
jgi:hypothetical protein